MPQLLNNTLEMKSLIQKLITKAIMVYPEHHTKIKTPGKLIKGLSKEERELIKKAKSKDFYHRI